MFPPPVSDYTLTIIALFGLQPENHLEAPVLACESSDSKEFNLPFTNVIESFSFPVLSSIVSEEKKMYRSRAIDEP